MSSSGLATPVCDTSRLEPCAGGRTAGERAASRVSPPSAPRRGAGTSKLGLRCPGRPADDPARKPGRISRLNPGRPGPVVAQWLAPSERERSGEGERERERGRGLLNRLLHIAGVGVGRVSWLSSVGVKEGGGEGGLPAVGAGGAADDSDDSDDSDDGASARPPLPARR
jgi:hypothetical protein